MKSDGRPDMVQAATLSLSAGTVLWVTPGTLGAGMRVLTVRYLGDANVAGSISAESELTIG